MRIKTLFFVFLTLGLIFNVSSASISQGQEKGQAQEQKKNAPVHGIPTLSQQLEERLKQQEEWAKTTKNSTDENVKTDAECPSARITVPKGIYHFYWDQAEKAEYYISNHDQANPRYVGITLKNLKNVTLDGSGSTLIFHGKMLPIVMINCQNCAVENFNIDFAFPAISQLRIVENSADGITARIDDDVQYELKDGIVWFKGENWTHSSHWGIAFDPVKKNLVFNTSDIGINLSNAKETADRTFFFPNWKNDKLIPGTVVAARPYDRPACAFFLYLNTDTSLRNINVHYAEGMGLLAQLCNNIHLDGFSICLPKNSTRYFSAQADATHFSGCRGMILVENSLFEAMMDDAINIHGTYLKATKRIDNQTLQGTYMHPQAYGFLWGNAGDRVCFVRSETMEAFPENNEIESIKAVDKPSEFGAKVFEIKFKNPLPESLLTGLANGESFGMENLTWTPSVIFRNNIIRNNRARGALFSTPQKTLIEKNFFDHTSGTAILFCGDCNGWFETGACRQVIIRDNHFLNALTNMFQFTNAVISIYPEIPHLDKQTAYFHGGTEDAFVIENNLFETFDRPILYARSTDGIVFQGNTIKSNKDFPAFHWNNHTFMFERVKNFRQEKNQYDWNFSETNDILFK